jgi:hypothetical protein
MKKKEGLEGEGRGSEEAQRRSKFGKMKVEEVGKWRQRKEPRRSTFVDTLGGTERIK